MFNGGMATDPRDPAANKSRYAVNFDILTNSYKLVPHHDSESGDSAAATSQKRNFCIGNWLPASTNDWRLFSLGVKSGGSLAEVLMKTLGAGGSNDLSDSGWATPAVNQSASGSTSFNLFTFYKTTGKIYGAAAGTHIWAFTPDGSTGFNDSVHSLTYANICEGLVHSMNDIMYVGYDNKIATNNAGSWADAVLTLPDSLYITALAEYGNYLAIMAAPLSGVGSSKVFLWDMSATTWNTLIDWGEGVGKVIQSLNGTLIGISISGGLGDADSAAVFGSKVMFKYYTGSGADTFAIFTGANGDSLISSKQRIDNRLLFMMSITIDGTIYAGTWSVGRTGTGAFTIVQESTLNNDVAPIGGDTINGFIKVGDYLFQSYTTSGTFYLSKTNDQASYTATSIYQTTINEGMKGDEIELKQLLSAGLMYEPLPSAGQAVLKYKVDGGSWTTIFTETTDGVVYTEPFTNAGGTEFTSGKEYELRAESTGGAVISGILYKYQVIPSNV
jgi:hypothetical protein